jgi:hypothetical protein
LCWTTLNAQARPVEYRALSWSWAAVDSPVELGPTCNFTASQTFINPLQSEVDALGHDPYGGVKSGALWFECEMLVRGINVSLFEVSWDCIGENDPRVGFYFLPVYRTNTQFVGLVLIPTSASHGQYRRVGTFATKALCYLNTDSAFVVESTDYQAQKWDFVQDYRGINGSILEYIIQLI